MRIIAGAWRGRVIEPPPGRGTRPTADRVRETLFSMLASRLGSFEKLRVADLYAGSGALGLEALSRGAAEVVFVESGPRVLPVLRKNLAAVGLPGARVISGPVSGVVAGPPPARFDLVLADPPYATPVDEVRGVLGG